MWDSRLYCLLGMLWQRATNCMASTAASYCVTILEGWKCEIVSTGLALSEAARENLFHAYLLASGGLLGMLGVS